MLAAALCFAAAGRADAQASPADSAGAATAAVRVCVVDTAGPRWQPAVVRAARHDTVVVVGTDSLPWGRAPGAIRSFAAGRRWYEESRPIRLLRPDSRPPPMPLGRPYRADYVKVGSPWVLAPEAGRGVMTAFGTYDGVALYGERGPVRPPEVYLVPVAPGCVFQAYAPAVMY